MKTLNVRNLYGYPSVTKTIKEYADAHGMVVIVDQVALSRIKKVQLGSKQPKILIENPAVLLTLGIPILGYQDRQGFFQRIPFPSPEQLEPNKLVIKVHSKWNRLKARQFVQALKAKRKDQFLESLDPKSDEYRATKAMFSRFLPPSLVDPFDPPKDAQKRKRKSGAPQRTPKLLPTEQQEQ